MPKMYFDRVNKVFAKQCSHCKELTIGTSDYNESFKIISRSYAPSGPSSGMADGLQSRCWACNASKRRALGITRKVLQDMWDKQNGQCKICDKGISIERGAHSTIHANVDHDEATGQVRGLLCGDCNRGIGLLKHSQRNLHQAAKYLMRFEIETSVVLIRRRG